MSKEKPAGLRLSKKLEKKTVEREVGLKKPFNLIAVLKKAVTVVGLLGRLFKLIDKLWDFLSNFF